MTIETYMHNYILKITSKCSSFTIQFINLTEYKNYYLKISLGSKNLLSCHQNEHFHTLQITPLTNLLNYATCGGKLKAKLT